MARTRFVGPMAVMSLLASTTGCSAIGLMVGSDIPRAKSYPGEHVSTLRAAEERGDIAVGDRVKVETSSAQPSVVTGRYDAVHDGALSLRKSSQTLRIPLEDVRRAEIEHGSYWATGLAVGLGLDVIAAFVVSGLSSKPPGGSRD